MGKCKLKGKCKYCGIAMDKMFIRCYKCDIAFQDGVEFGRAEIRLKLREAWAAVKNFIGESEDA